VSILNYITDSYFSLVYPSDPDLWKTNLGPIGGLKEWLTADRRSPLPSYLTEADKERLTRALLDNGGVRAPLLWYNYMVDGYTAKESKCQSIMLLPCIELELIWNNSDPAREV
jgi:soluble epoxide hydrolase/lipid-phosphate phosphatase